MSPAPAPLDRRREAARAASCDARRVHVGLPDTSAWPRWGRDNVLNAALVLATPLPAIVVTWLLFHAFAPGAIPPAPERLDLADPRAAAAWLLHRPLLSLNLLYFVFVNLQFFAVALVQRSSWLIDPYWTLLPLFIAGFYAAHPLAEPQPTRLGLAAVALAIWSLRLTGNYFRREDWRFGLREDWRYAKMRRERPGFWWQQFFVVHLAQHGMLVGLTLPFWAICFRPVPLSAADLVCLGLAWAGISIAHVADVQLDRFMRGNEERRARGEEPVRVLRTGIWRLSRHPNYFGEQLFWWSIAGFGVVCGEPWVVVGTLFNSSVLAAVTVMTERRMLDVPERRDAYAAYRARTSVWIPWPPRREDAAAPDRIGAPARD